MRAGVPQDVPAYGINMLCGSGLKAVALGVQSIMAGDSQVGVVRGKVAWLSIIQNGAPSWIMFALTTVLHLPGISADRRGWWTGVDEQCRALHEPAQSPEDG